MSLYHLPLITSSIEISIKPDGSQILEHFIAEASKTIWNFLKITSLAQTIWHDWAFLEVREILDEQRMLIKPILHKLRSPKSAPPYIRMNAVAIYIERFVKSGWNGYSPGLQDKYGFDMALEWYIHSNMGGPLETKFLNAAAVESSSFQILLKNVSIIIQPYTRNHSEACCISYKLSKFLCTFSNHLVCVYPSYCL